jgi:hypothetical protein
MCLPLRFDGQSICIILLASIALTLLIFLHHNTTTPSVLEGTRFRSFSAAPFSAIFRPDTHWTDLRSCAVSSKLSIWISHLPTEHPLYTSSLATINPHFVIISTIALVLCLFFDAGNWVWWLQDDFCPRVLGNTREGDNNVPLAPTPTGTLFT